MNEQPDLNASSVTENPQQTPQQQDPYAALVLPENSLLTPAMLGELKKQAADEKLSVLSLQQWVTLEENHLQAYVRQQAQAQQAQRDVWAERTQTIFGENWQEEVSRAVRAADLFGGPELRELLEETGLGNHPAIVRTFAQVGKRIVEDVLAVGTPSASADKTFTQALYGKQ